MDELRDKIESTVITRSFHISGMPESVFKEVDEFCKEFYGDSRWAMVADLMRMTKEDLKFSMLYDEIEAVKQRVVHFEERKDEKKRVDPFNKTFGSRKVNENE